MDSEQIQLLGRLCEACAVSGDEGAVRSIVLEQVTPVADHVRVDPLGNVLVRKQGAGEALLRVLVAAHMDEVGLMLTGTDSEGFYRFEPVGGVNIDHLPGKAVWIGRDRHPGVIGAKAVHLTNQNERDKKIAIENLRIDSGSNGSKKVKVGDRATFASPFKILGESLCAKSLDDRLGVLLLIELVKNSPSNLELLAAFTVQEEVGLRGARVAAYALDPQAAIVLDCTPANDLPISVDDKADGVENALYNTILGGGPAIYVADRGSIYDPRLIQHFIRTAESAGITYQIRQPGGGSTDAAEIHKNREGIPSISVSVPGRYLHTAASISRISDWDDTLRLVRSALEQLSEEVFKYPR